MYDSHLAAHDGRQDFFHIHDVRRQTSYANGAASVRWNSHFPIAHRGAPTPFFTSPPKEVLYSIPPQISTKNRAFLAKRPACEFILNYLTINRITSTQRLE